VQTFEDATTAAWPLHADDVEEEVQRGWAVPNARDENRQRRVGGNSTL